RSGLRHPMTTAYSCARVLPLRCAAPSVHLEGPQSAASTLEPVVKRGSREDDFCIQNFGCTTRRYGVQQSMWPSALLLFFSSYLRRQARSARTALCSSAATKK